MNWSRPLPGPISISEVMEVETLDDVRTLIGHLPKASRAKVTWQFVEADLKNAAAGGDVSQLSIGLQMVLQLEHVQFELKGPSIKAT